MKLMLIKTVLMTTMMTLACGSSDDKSNDKKNSGSQAFSPETVESGTEQGTSNDATQTTPFSPFNQDGKCQVFNRLTKYNNDADKDSFTKEEFQAAVDAGELPKEVLTKLEDDGAFTDGVFKSEECSLLPPPGQPGDQRPPQAGTGDCPFIAEFDGKNGGQIDEKVEIGKEFTDERGLEIITAVDQNQGNNDGFIDKKECPYIPPKQ